MAPRRVVPGFRWDAEHKVGYVDLWVDGRGSHRMRRTLRGLSYRRALARFAELKDELKQPTQPKGMPSLREYVRDYDRLRPLAESTQRDYARMLRLRILPALGDVPLNEVTVDRALELRSTILKGGASNATANRYTTLVRMLLNEAVQRGLLATHPIPTGTLKLLREPPPITAYLTDDERKRFIRAFDDEQAFRDDIRNKRVARKPKRGKQGYRRYGGSIRHDTTAANDAFKRFQRSKLFFLTALDTGLSKGDLRSLTWDHIDLERNLIYTRRAKSGIPTAIPLTTRLQNALQALDHRQGTVLTTTGGKPWDESTINRYYTKAKKLAGITRPFRFHDLRHDFASSLAKQGISLYTISKLLGHTTTTMTQRYAHLHPDSLKEAISQLKR